MSLVITKDGKRRWRRCDCSYRCQRKAVATKEDTETGKTADICLHHFITSANVTAHQDRAFVAYMPVDLEDTSS